MSQELFIPPKSISTERLLIRPFTSAEEARELVSYQATISTKEKLGYYEDNNSPFKEYAIFLRSTNEFIGTIDVDGTIVKLEPEKPYISSSHIRTLHTNYQNSGYGTEVLKAIIDNLVEPAIGKMVLTSPVDIIKDVYVAQKMEYIPFRQHTSSVSIDNYPSVFSNIKAGMCVDGMIKPDGYFQVEMVYPARDSAPNQVKVKSLFKTLAAYDATMKPIEWLDEALRDPLKGILKDALKDILVDIILSTKESHTVIAAAHILLEKCDTHVKDEALLLSKLQEAYHAAHEKFEVYDGITAMWSFNGVQYDAENDLIYQEAMEIAGIVSDLDC